MLRLGIPTAETIDITGGHPLLAGGPFEGGDWMIRARVVTDADVDRFRRKHQSILDGRIAIDVVAAHVELFVDCVVAWENIAGEDGKPLPCDAATKRKVATFHGPLRTAILDIAAHRDVTVDAREEEAKN
jgi:hypothetical protein